MNEQHHLSKSEVIEAVPLACSNELAAVELGKDGPWKGKIRGPHSPEWNEKIGASNRGKLRSLEARMNISDGHLGYKHTSEARAKMSAYMLGKPGRHNNPHTEVAKKKMNTARKGKPWTEERRKAQRKRDTNVLE